MFVAFTKNQQRLSLLTSDSSVNYPPPPYYCPVCRQEVMMKQGTQRRWHFAHHRSLFCPDASEPETEEHLAGKAELFKWLYSQGLSPILESYVPSIQRRADLLFSYQSQTYAIEFQCASISTEEALIRTKDYLSQNIIPLWIYSSKRLRLSTPSCFSIHSFEWVGLRERRLDGHRALVYFSPFSSSFFFLFPRAALTSVKTFADIYAVLTGHTSISSLLQLPATKDGISTWKNQWLRKKKQWRYEKNDWRNQQDKRYVRQVFASYRSDIPYFPGEAGWPVRGMEYFETSAYLWQSVFLLAILATVPLYHTFSLRTVVDSFSPLMAPYFKTRPLPLITTPLEDILSGYLQMLQRIGIVRQTSSGWMRVEPIFLPESLDEGYHMDKKRYQSIFYE